jgi:hypothetical protein
MCTDNPWTRAALEGLIGVRGCTAGLVNTITTRSVVHTPVPVHRGTVVPARTLYGSAMVDAGSAQDSGTVVDEYAWMDKGMGLRGSTPVDKGPVVTRGAVMDSRPVVDTSRQLRGYAPVDTSAVVDSGIAAQETTGGPVTTTDQATTCRGGQVDGRPGGQQTTGGQPFPCAVEQRGGGVSSQTDPPLSRPTELGPHVSPGLPTSSGPPVSPSLPLSPPAQTSPPIGSPAPLGPHDPNSVSPDSLAQPGAPQGGSSIDPLAQLASRAGIPETPSAWVNYLSQEADTGGRPAPKRDVGRPQSGSEDWAPHFIEQLMTGCSLKDAARLSNISQTVTLRRRATDPEFAEAWRTAAAIGTEHLEEEAARRAYHGTLKPVFYKGVKCGVVREYSDSLMMFLLKGRKPEVYRDNVGDNVRGDKYVQVNVQAAEQVRDMIRRGELPSIPADPLTVQTITDNSADTGNTIDMRGAANGQNRGAGQMPTPAQSSTPSGSGQQRQVVEPPAPGTDD